MDLFDRNEFWQIRKKKHYGGNYYWHILAVFKPIPQICLNNFLPIFFSLKVSHEMRFIAFYSYNMISQFEGFENNFCCVRKWVFWNFPMNLVFFIIWPIFSLTFAYIRLWERVRGSSGQANQKKLTGIFHILHVT